MRRFLTSSVVLAFAFGAGGMGVAMAQVPGVAPDPSAPPAEPAPVAAPMETTPATSTVQTGGTQIDRPATLEAGRILLKVPVLINLSKDLVGKPVSVAPDIYYGVNDDFTLGITHTNGSLVYPAIAGDGLCLTGDSNGCPKVYNNVGLDSLYRFINTPALQLAAHAGVYLWQISDPLLTVLRVGAYGEWQAGIFELRFDPGVFIGLNKRDAGNIEQLIQVPVGGFVNVTPDLDVFVLAALTGPTKNFGDFWTGLLSFGASYAVNPMMDVGLAFDFPNLWGKNSSADSRQARLFGNFRF